MKSNHLRAKHIETIEVNHVAPRPLHAMSQWQQQMNM
jgi:hypothetical protein